MCGGRKQVYGGGGGGVSVRHMTVGGFNELEVFGDVGFTCSPTRQAPRQ